MTLHIYKFVTKGNFIITLAVLFLWLLLRVFSLKFHVCIPNLGCYVNKKKWETVSNCNNALNSFEASIIQPQTLYHT